MRLGREHVYWEGTPFPADRNRPVCNLFHTKLCVIVDWKPLYRSSSSGSTRSLFDSRFNHQEFEEDESYTNFVQNNMTVNKSSTGATTKLKEKGVALQECLRVYAGQEELDENTWFCEKCNKLSKATVHTSLQLVPDSLIIHIKRFNMTARYGEKMRTLVNFPLRGLNLYQFTTDYKRSQESQNSGESTAQEKATTGSLASTCETPQNYIYDLYGVTNHIGHMNGGHYTAFVNCRDHMEAAVLANTHQSNDNNNSSSSSSSSRGGGFLSTINSPAAVGPDDLVDQLVHRLHLNPSDSTAVQAEGLYGSYLDMSSIHSVTHFSGSEFNDSTNNGKWFLFDDEVVEEVPQDNLNQNIVTDAAYLLFYRKRQLTPSTIVNFIS